MIAVRPSIRRLASRSAQRGAALLTAMIIVTLVATLAAAMVWQQWRSVQVEGAERARVQAAWILAGVRDFGQRILAEDAKSRVGNEMTALTEPWATPLAESRISTFLAVDPSNADDGPEAFISGSITDAQSRYNLRQLIGEKDGKRISEPEQVEILGRLCQAAGVDASVAERIANGLRDAAPPATAAGASLMPTSVAELTWLGIDEASVKALQPYVMLMGLDAPNVPKVNVNTASKEVLSALLQIDVATAELIVQTRQRKSFKDPSELVPLTGGKPLPLAAGLGVRSEYFEVNTRLRLLDRVLSERSIVYRPAGAAGREPRNFRVLSRERVAGIDPAGN